MSSFPSTFYSRSDSCSSSNTSPQPDGRVPPSKNTLKEPDNTVPQPEDVPSLSPPKDPIMSNARSVLRNVHIFNASDRSNSIGGLCLTSGITKAVFYTMVEIVVIATSNFTLQNESDVTLQKDNSPLPPGNYYINSPSPFALNSEAILLRTISVGTGTRVKAFRDAVRLRDGRCAITGKGALSAQHNLWTGLEAAHLFPLAYEKYWKDNDLGRWITVVPDAGGKINSMQNGLLLRSDLHQLFDMYLISINPDDNHKIVCFVPDENDVAGKHLDRRLLDHPHRPVDQLLRWHFRQAVLANMKGAGEPVFEHDFPPGSDMIGSILSGPRASERMEFELFNRLATQFSLAE